MEPKFKILGRMRLLELDEMHTYIGSKKNIAGYGVLLIEMQKDSSTGFKGELSQDKHSKASLKNVQQEA